MAGRSSIRKLVGALRQRKASEQAAIEKAEREAAEATTIKVAEAYPDIASENASVEAQYLAEQREAMGALISHKDRFSVQFKMMMMAEAEERQCGPRNVMLQAHNCPVCPVSIRQLEQQQFQKAIDMAETHAQEQYRATMASRQLASSAMAPGGFATGGSSNGRSLNPNAKVWQPSAPTTAWQQPHLAFRPQQPALQLGAVNQEDPELRRIKNERVSMAIESLPPHVTRDTHKLNTAEFRTFWAVYNGPILQALGEIETVTVKLRHTRHMFARMFGGRLLEDLMFDLHGLEYQLSQAWDKWNQDILAVESECLWVQMLQVRLLKAYIYRLLPRRRSLYLALN